MVNSTGFRPVLALSLALSAAWAVPGHAEGETAQTVVATVNGADITLGQVVALRETLPQEYQALADDVLFNGILEQLIQQTALAQSQEDKLTARDEVMIANQRRTYVSGAALQAVVATAVTDATIQAAYDAKYKGAAPVTEYRASHILVETEEQAKDLKAQLDGGADFAGLAKANSTDGSAAGGGDLGWFGPGMMVKPFEDAVISLQPGQVSAPVQTQFGWHLIRLAETRDAAAPPLADVRADLSAELQRQAIEAHVAAITGAATITRVEGIDPGVVRSETLFDK
ncbi:MAG: peptidylprolyl isomerase, partial [Rhodobacter sp.]|jgi:peptidyl-prolyl cis-trans isomerase C